MDWLHNIWPNSYRLAFVVDNNNNKRLATGPSGDDEQKS
jgi:hypothetical protein